MCTLRFVGVLGVMALVAPGVLFAVAPTDEGFLTNVTNYPINVGAVDAFDPHVSADLVAYTSNEKIRYYDFLSGNDMQVPSPYGATDLLSDVSDRRIVFTRFFAGHASLMVYNTVDNSTIEVDPQPASLRFGAAIGSNTVAFIDQTASSAGDLYASFLGGSTSQLTNDGRLDQNPNVLHWETSSFMRAARSVLLTAISGRLCGTGRTGLSRRSPTTPCRKTIPIPTAQSLSTTPSDRMQGMSAGSRSAVALSSVWSCQVSNGIRR